MHIDDKNNPQAHYARSKLLRSFSVSKHDLIALYNLLQHHANEALRLNLESINDAQFDLDMSEKIHTDMNNAYRVSMQIKTNDGATISQNDLSIFDKPDFPDKIESVYLSTHHDFAGLFPGYLPRNYFVVFLDFRRMPIALNFINLPSNPTPNESSFHLNGLDESWVDSTFVKLEKFFNDRQNRRGFIHKSGVYDLFLYVFFVPFALYWAMQIEIIIMPYFQEINSKFVLVFIYGYIVIIFGVLARFIYQYLRWIFPTVEYKSGRIISQFAHRAVLSIISLTLVLPLIVEALKRLLFS